MASKRHKPEKIVAKLHQVDVLQGQGMSPLKSHCAQWDCLLGWLPLIEG